jgi:hypothetical protein
VVQVQARPQWLRAIVVCSIVLMRNRNRCRPSEPSRSPRFGDSSSRMPISRQWNFLHQEEQAARAALRYVLGHSFSLVPKSLYACEGRGVGPPRLTPRPATHRGTIQASCIGRQKHGSPRPQHQVGSDEASLVRVKVMRSSRACANTAPLKNQPIGRHQAAHRMAETTPQHLFPHQSSLRHIEARSVKMRFNRQANVFGDSILIFITHYTV